MIKSGYKNWFSFFSLSMLLVTIILCSFTLQDDNLITWSPTRKLKWSDFLATPDYKSEHGAITTTMTHCRPYYREDTIFVNIKVLMVKNESWVKISDTTASMLPHEQTHFDLAELFARKLRKDACYLVVTSKADYNAKFGKLFRLHQDSLDAAQDQYDLETGHSGRRLIQQAWQKKVLDELYEYSQYCDILVKIPIRDD